MWLIKQECPKDDMGLKALQLAIHSGSPELLACCFLEDVKFEDRGEADHVANVRLKLALEAKEVAMLSPLARFVTVHCCKWLPGRCYEYARSGDMDMLGGLEEFIADSDDSPHFLFNVIQCAAEEGHFSVAAHFLECHWTREAEYGGGRREVPNNFLFCVARLGSLKTLQWCRSHCDVVSADFCSSCVDVEGWGRVVEDAAGAGHVDMVLWCLDNGWEYTSDMMRSAAGEGRSNVVRALEERGYSCEVKINEKATPAEGEGDKFWGKCKIPLCEC